MKIFTKYIILYSLCLLFSECTNRENKSIGTNKVVTKNDITTKTVIDVEKDKTVKEKTLQEKKNNIDSNEYRINYRYRDKSVKLADCFTDIHYVPLETNDASLLTNNPNRLIYKNGYIYVSDIIAGNSTVLLFDEKGKYIRQIGSEGQGPEEHLGFITMNVGLQGHVSMIDRFYMGAITYTTEGDFVSRIRMDSISITDAVYLNDSLLMIKSDYDRPGHKFHLLNINSKQIVSTSYPIKKRMYRIGFKEGFTAYQDKVLLSEYHSNEVLELTAEGIKVRYVLNINNKMPPKGFWEQKVKDYSEIMMEETQHGYIGHIPAFAESDQLLFFRFKGSLGKKEAEGMAIINKETRKYDTFNHIALTDKFEIEPDFFYAQSDGQVIFLLTAEDILNSGDNDFIARFPGLVEDSNPVLLFATLK